MPFEQQVEVVRLDPERHHVKVQREEEGRDLRWGCAAALRVRRLWAPVTRSSRDEIAVEVKLFERLRARVGEPCAEM